MASNDIPLFNQINVSEFTYSTPSKGKDGSSGFTSWINLGQTRASIWAQVASFPESAETAADDPNTCRLPFGVSDPPKQNPEATKRGLCFSLATPELQQWAQSIDNMNLSTVLANYDAWFPEKADVTRDLNEWIQEQKMDGNDPTEEEIAAEKANILKQRNRAVKKSYHPFFVPGKEKEKDGVKTGEFYEPYCNAKCHTTGDKEVEVYFINSRGELTQKTWADITPGMKTVPFIEIMGLWFTSAGWGTLCTVRKIFAFPRSSGPRYTAGVGNVGLPSWSTGSVVADTGDDSMDSVDAKTEAAIAAETRGLVKDEEMSDE